jgi:hypothetical protein
MLNFFARSGRKIEKIDSLGPGEGFKTDGETELKIHKLSAYVMIKAASQRLDYDDRHRERKRNGEKRQDQDRPTPTVTEVQRVPDTVPLCHEQIRILPVDVKNSPFPKLIRVHEGGESPTP